MEGHPKTVLVVDDDFASLEVLALMLAGEGYRVLTASDGEEALERLRSELSVDLVLSDYKMPKMNGVELFNQMAADERLAAVPIMLMSATYRPGPGTERCVGIFVKPLYFDRLLATIKRVLG